MKTCTQRKLQSSSLNLNGQGPAEGRVNFAPNDLLLSDGPGALHTLLVQPSQWGQGSTGP